MISLQVLAILFIIRFTSGTCFTFKSSNQNVANKIWNDLYNTNNIDKSIENDIENLVNSYRKTKNKFRTGCFESKPVVTQGNVPEWTKYSNFITKFTNNSSNRNYQIFKSNSRVFYNLSEYNGNKFFATASGSLTGNNDNLLATVTEITIYVMLFQKYRKISFNVNGKGIINIIFESDQYRIVQNEKKAMAFQKKVPIPNEYKVLLNID